MRSHGLGERCERRLSRRELLGHVAAAGVGSFLTTMSPTRSLATGGCRERATRP
jgi:hypothetical protein